MRDTTRNDRHLRGAVLAVLLALLALLALVAAAVLLLDGRTVRFYVFGDAEMHVEFGTPFTDPGVYAVTAGELFGESEDRLPVAAEGSVDTGRLGTYTLRYSTRWAFADYSTERRVIVEDTTPPVLELRHLQGYEPSWMTGYTEEGYTALDACDGDLTAEVQLERLDDRVIYTVRDRSGNEARAERMLPAVRIQPPDITLLGGERLQIDAGLWFSDPGATVRDAAGNDLGEYLHTEGQVIPWVPGEYPLTYSITNELGETVSAVRTVQVVPVVLPETVKPSGKTIYLTFDDGPGPYTSQLLDVLDRYGVKATFFVTAQNSKYYDQIGRAFRAGHSIGVHSESHNYNKIYAGELAFFEDFFDMEEIIFQQTGSYTKLFRFPGGSSNTVSNFNPGIMSRLTKAMNAMGYQYYDWNVSSGDAGETNRTDQIVKNIKAGCSTHQYSVVLQHDIKDYSVAAVEQVIQWGQANGYRFEALRLDSPSAHHGVNN